MKYRSFFRGISVKRLLSLPIDKLANRLSGSMPTLMGLTSTATGILLTGIPISE